MRHDDLRREAAAMIAAKPASALLCATAVVWYLVWVGGRAGVWVCVLWWNERCDGFKYTLSTNFFRLDKPVEPLSRQKLSRKSSRSKVQESPIWASVEKAVFDRQIRL